MRNGTCPKCGASSVYKRTAGISRGDGGVHIYTGATETEQARRLRVYRLRYLREHYPASGQAPGHRKVLVQGRLRPRL